MVSQNNAVYHHFLGISRPPPPPPPPPQSKNRSYGPAMYLIYLTSWFVYYVVVSHLRVIIVSKLDLVIFKFYLRNILWTIPNLIFGEGVLFYKGSFVYITSYIDFSFLFRFSIVE